MHAERRRVEVAEKYVCSQLYFYMYAYRIRHNQPLFRASYPVLLRGSNGVLVMTKMVPHRRTNNRISDTRGIHKARAQVQSMIT